jgi:27-O-demethylrifamycin SV methyltransferase
MPPWPPGSELTTLLGNFADAPAAPERGRSVEVDAGLLVCGPCGRWYPIVRGIPEMLSDHLRDANREAPIFEAAVAAVPASLADALRRFHPSPDASSDPGAHHKRAEITIETKVDEPLFFVPGRSSPFAYWDSDFSIYLIKLFGAAAPLLSIGRGDVLVDSGCGYAWTTEWLFRSGFDPIGVDICRTYLEVGIARMGMPRPHLVVGDVENLPLATDTARAVLAYESFHHVPDRRRAMAGYHRVLQPGGTVVLAEPGAAHEAAKASVDAMEKYGILEKGMELDDVKGYAEGTTFAAEQILTLRAPHTELGARLDEPFVRARSVVEGNLFRLVKGGGAGAPAQPPALQQTGLLGTLRRRLKSAVQTFLPHAPRQ